MQSISPEIGAYAGSLLSLAQAGGLLSLLEREVPVVTGFLASEEALRRFLSDPTVNVAGKAAAIEKILASQVHPVLVRFLQILQEQGRMHLWPDIAGEFLCQLASLQQAASGEITSAVPLSDDRVAEVEREVGRILGRRIRMRVRIDDSMLGGHIVRVGNFVLDGSIDSELETLRRDLAAAAGLQDA